MTIPANLQLEQAPYGPQPVVLYFGPQGGPYTVGGTSGVSSTGPDAESAAPAGNPLRVAGWDGTSLRTLRTDQIGEVAIAGNATAVDGAKASALGIGIQAGVSQSWPLAVGTMVYTGVAVVYARTPVIFKDINALALVAGTGATVWTPAAGKKFRLMGGWFSSSAAAALILGDNAVGTVIFRTPLLAAAGVFAIPPIGNGVLSAAANNVLKLDVSVASTVTGCVFGTEE